MHIDSHRLFSLEPASPVYRVLQAHVSRWQSGVLPGNATRQRKGSCGQVSDMDAIAMVLEWWRARKQGNLARLTYAYKRSEILWWLTVAL